nr:hypothetical protein [uncultured Draconibacterium sp.]
MKHKILRIDKIEELDSLEEPFRIRIHLKYPRSRRFVIGVQLKRVEEKKL